MADANEVPVAPEAVVSGLDAMMSAAEEMSFAEDDPRARWRVLPDRIPPEQWIVEKADRAVPGSVEVAEAESQDREAWNVLRLGFG